MPTSITQVRQQALAFWAPLTRIQKLSLAGVALGAIAAIVGFLFASSQPNYVPVYTKLGEADAGAVAAKLKELKIPYELGEGGTTIKVPSAKASEARIELAKAGLPTQAGVGFELFDKTNFGLTDFNQKLNYQRALEGELSRTIGQMAMVEQARVHITQPKQELFSSKENKPTAAVVLKMRPGGRLDSGSVRAIMTMATGAVEGLKPENVSIVDLQGNILWDEKADGQQGGSRVAQNYLDARARYERESELKIQTMLDRVLGAGKATAKVSAEIDWDTVQTAKETYGSAQPRSSREVSEKFTGSGASAGGVPGITPNVPGTGSAATSSPGANNNYEKKDVTTNFEMAKTVETISKAPGSIKKLSVAVFIDNLADPGSLPAITQAVSNAAGLNADRGDTVTVNSIAFDRSAEDAERRSLEAASQAELYMVTARGAAVALAMLITALFVRSLYFGKRRSSAPGVEVEEFGPQVPVGLTTAAGIANAIAAHNVVGAIEAAKAKAIELDSPMTEEGQLLEEQIQALAKSKPHQLAQILTTWLNETD